MFIKFKVTNTGATNGFPILHYCFIMSVMDTLQFQSLPSGSRKQVSLSVKTFVVSSIFASNRY